MKLGTYNLSDDIVTELRDQTYTRPDYKSEMELAESVVDNLHAYSQDMKFRRTLRAYVVTNKDVLCFWRITCGEEEWDSLLAELYSNNVGQRDIDAIKRTVNEEFKKLYDNYVITLEKQYLKIENVVEIISADFKNGVVILKIV